MVETKRSCNGRGLKVGIAETRVFDTSKFVSQKTMREAMSASLHPGFRTLLLGREIIYMAPLHGTTLPAD